MKKTKLLPQHIPNGQQYREQDLEELNAAIKKTAGRGLLLFLAVIPVFVVLAVLAATLIGGAVGFGTAALLMILMPAVLGIVGKAVTKKQNEAAARIGLSPEQTAAAIRNRNKSVAAWGEIPAPAPLTEGEIRVQKKKKLKIALAVVAVIVALPLAVLAVYEVVRAVNAGGGSEIVLSMPGAEISAVQRDEIVSVLERRFEALKEEGSKAGTPSFRLKDGKLVCRSNSVINEYNYTYFFLRGDFCIISKDTGNILFDADDFETVEFKYEKYSTGALMIKFTEQAFERLKETKDTLSIKTGEKVLPDTSFGVGSINSLSAEWMAEHAEGRKCEISRVARELYVAYLYPLPFELDVEFKGK